MSNNKKQIEDVLIVGAGPIGLACGLAAQKRGLSYRIIEKGCLVNSLYNYPDTMTFFSSSDRLEIGDIPFVTTLPKPKRAEALEYYRRIQDKFDLTVQLFEKVIDIKKEGPIFSVKTNKGSYQSKQVVIATGFYDLPVMLNVPGEDLEKVKHYYKDPHYYANQDVVVVGASNSAIDAALETYRKGARVTLVIRGPEVSHRVKYWVRPDVLNRIAEGEIKAYFNSQLTAIHPGTVEVQTPLGQVTFKNDFVLALTGYRPNFEFLEKVGVQIADEAPRIPFHDPGTMETNIKGLYLAGVVCGGLNTHLWFIENSRIHADIIMEHIRAGM
ncbi:MAG TPA: YpdA family putative bacillithiol disulfide reductase [Candidatus Sphingobacterium stercoripullorum]|uniref:YpdA family putative bacillithiol disulfide reductase n=1 Tax=Candidatus Sphingobacterium stercoripullorum TaxID=2838759 RepID=A0A9D2AZ48_9SPHI|nr:YpdA family putative bacillithiol disulfide reductase [Candidatus Sphingobacterium stercoripullorum]